MLNQSTKICPLCVKAGIVPPNYLDPVDARNALSRKDNATYICNYCGTAEALSDFTKVPFETIRFNLQFPTGNDDR